LGIANQLLASIALAVGTTYLLNHASKRSYALCTGIPFVFVLATVLVAGVQSVMRWWGGLAAAKPGDVFLIKLTCALAIIMQLLTVIIAVDSIRVWYQKILGTGRPSLPVVVTETV